MTIASADHARQEVLPVQAEVTPTGCSECSRPLPLALRRAAVPADSAARSVRIVRISDRTGITILGPSGTPSGHSIRRL